MTSRMQYLLAKRTNNFHLRARMGICPAVQILRCSKQARARGVQHRQSRGLRHASCDAVVPENRCFSGSQ
jgi:hypothetical protein